MTGSKTAMSLKSASCSRLLGLFGAGLSGTIACAIWPFRAELTFFLFIKEHILQNPDDHKFHHQIYKVFDDFGKVGRLESWKVGRLEGWAGLNRGESDWALDLEREVLGCRLME